MSLNNSDLFYTAFFVSFNNSESNDAKCFCSLHFQDLLSMLVNKLGDPDHKTAAKAAHLLCMLGECMLNSHN